jgi:hypothetical protein
VITTNSDTGLIEMARECEPLNDLVKRMEADPTARPGRDVPVLHRFTPGLYSRTVVLEAGEYCVSLIHKTRHQFAILDGVAVIWSPKSGWQIVKSPYQGVTEVGERRAVRAICRVTWATYHATEKTDIAEIEGDLFA